MGNYQWAQPFNTNGYNGWWSNPGVKTDNIGMPVFRTDRYGNHPFYMGSIHRGYASGPASIWQGIYYAGVETQGGHLFGNSGGVFSFFIRGSAGTLRFGRDEPAGRSVLSENEAYSWGGTLAGSFDWAEVPTPPQNWTVNFDPGTRLFTFGVNAPADNGNSAIYAYGRETNINGGGWGLGTQNWTEPVEGVPGNSYAFRIWAYNGVGESQPTESGYIAVPYSGGRRATGPTTTTPITTSKRFNGSSFVDLTTRKRYTGTSWVDITN